MRHRWTYSAAVFLLSTGFSFAQPASSDVSASSWPSQSEQQQLQQNVKDIQFDFDSSELRPDAHAVLQSDAQWLKAHPNVHVTIEGNADERGDIVYNVVLSQDRATITKNALVQ